MSVETFSKGLVEIIASSDDSERVENEILQVFKSLSDSSEALDVFRNFGIPVEKKIEACTELVEYKSFTFNGRSCHTHYISGLCR
jgi:hypothetical protein